MDDNGEQQALPAIRSPWIETMVAVLVGLGLFMANDILPHLQRGEPFPEHYSDWFELLVMGPGFGCATWFILRYRDLRAASLALAVRGERARRFTHLGRLAGSVAHEVRNPLHNSHLLVEALRDDPQDTALLDRLDDNLSRIDRAVDLVWTLARHRQDLGEQVCELDAVLAILREENGPRLVARYAADATVRVRGDPDQTRIVVGNLVRNALQAGAGPVTMELEKVDDRVALRLTNQGHLPSWLAEGGEPPPGSRGLGLGLAISRQLADLQGHRLTFASGSVGAGVESVQTTLVMPLVVEEGVAL